MYLLDLSHDLLRETISRLDRKDRLNILKSCKFFLNFDYRNIELEVFVIHRVDFTQTIWLDKINSLNIQVCLLVPNFPPKLTYLRLGNEKSYHFFGKTELGGKCSEIRYFDLGESKIPSLREVLSSLPKGLKDLELLSSINLDFEIDLPEGLEDLYYYGNQLGTRSGAGSGTRFLLPPNLKKLSSGHDFNQPLNTLPETLEVFNTGRGKFNQPLENFPSHLRILTIQSKYTHQLPPFPSSLKTLIYRNERILFREFPPYLEKLELITDPTNVVPELPGTLKIFKYQSIIGTTLLSFKIKLPEGLEEFRVKNLAFILPERLPSKLRVLELGKGFSHPIHHLPSRLEKLHINKESRHLLPEKLPLGIKILP